MARFLALLAIVAQLGLVVAGAAHQAAMLVQDRGVAVEVCTAWGTERVLLPAGDDSATEEPPSRGLPLTDCAVCAASGLLAGPATSPTCPPAPPVAVAAGPAAAAAPIPSRSHELPPTRGPPAVS
ncbi:MAG TPA: hypothetical protein PKB14_02065 [Rubrivivax sp.]|nr:hypothetical protein [Rubrivivax sp.]